LSGYRRREEEKAEASGAPRWGSPEGRTRWEITRAGAAILDASGESEAAGAGAAAGESEATMQIRTAPGERTMPGETEGRTEPPNGQLSERRRREQTGDVGDPQSALDEGAEA
jgi:hypothetical protein